MDVLNGVTLDQYIKDGNKEEEKAAISGAVFYHAVRLLGQKIINSMTSEMGDINNHEGVVIRDSSISSKPFKLTGNFIVRGLESRFAQQDNEEVSGLLQNIATANGLYVNSPYDRATGGTGAGGGTRVGAEVS